MKDKNVILLWSIILFIVCSTIIIIVDLNTKHSFKMAELGYCEIPTMGTNQILWQKCNSEKK